MDSYHSDARNCLYLWKLSPASFSAGTRTILRSLILVLFSPLPANSRVTSSMPDQRLARKVPISISTSLLNCIYAPNIDVMMSPTFWYSTLPHCEYTFPNTMPAASRGPIPESSILP